MKKNYLAPEAEVVTFAKEDVITSSGYIFNWDLPQVNVGTDNNCTWDENGEVYSF